MSKSNLGVTYFTIFCPSVSHLWSHDFGFLVKPIFNLNAAISIIQKMISLSWLNFTVLSPRSVPSIRATISDQLIPESNLKAMKTNRYPILFNQIFVPFAFCGVTILVLESNWHQIRIQRVQKSPRLLHSHAWVVQKLLSEIFFMTNEVE